MVVGEGGQCRIACRLDRDWEWKRLSAGAFLNEAQFVDDLDRVTRLVLALSVLQPHQDGLRFNTRVEGGPTIMNIFQENKDMRVVQDIIEMNTELGERKLRTSEKDLNKRFSALLRGALRASRTQAARISVPDTSFYHRQAMAESLRWRLEAEAALAETIATLDD